MSNSAGYIIEDTPEGRSLVVTGPWSAMAAQALSRGEADGLVLNYARGFREGTLDLLDSGWPLRRLSVLDRSLVNLNPIGRVQGLRELSVQAAADSELDLGSLPQLKSVSGEWSLIARTLGAVGGLEDIVTWMFDEADLHAFRDHLVLRNLTIKDAPYQGSLAGLSNLASLAALTIVGAPRLRDIDELGWLSASLRELKFEGCGCLDTIDAVASLVGLNFLGISESGDIASLSPVRPLSELETFFAWGSTRIVDGDLSPLGGLPRLKEIRMRNRRGYKPAVHELAAAVF